MNKEKIDKETIERFFNLHIAVKQAMKDKEEEILKLKGLSNYFLRQCGLNENEFPEGFCVIQNEKVLNKVKFEDIDLDYLIDNLENEIPVITADSLEETFESDIPKIQDKVVEAASLELPIEEKEEIKSVLYEIDNGNFVKSEVPRMEDIESQRLADVEAQRLADVEAKRLADVEAKRLADVEAKRLEKIAVNQEEEKNRLVALDLEEKKAELEKQEKELAEKSALLTKQLESNKTSENTDIVSDNLSSSRKNRKKIKEEKKSEIDFEILEDEPIKEEKRKIDIKNNATIDVNADIW